MTKAKSIPPQVISEVMSLMGKKSAEKRKMLGHDSNYYRKLVNKRWAMWRSENPSHLK